MASRCVQAAVVSVVAVAVAASGSAGAASTADPALARAMQRAGLVLVIRHAATDFSKPDQDPVVLADCSTQRNLNAQGRAEARAIGRGVRRLGLRIGAVLASPFCRTKETAQLAFGRFRVSRALLNTVTAEHDARWRRQIRAARRLLGTRPTLGVLTVLVTHGSVVTDATGQTLEEGETLVFRPLGSSRFRLLGRVLPREWQALRPLAIVARSQQYDSSIRPLPDPVRASLTGASWRPGCPVSLSQLRLLTVSHWGFDERVRQGQLVVHEDAARPLVKVFRRLYQLRFPIRHMRLDDMYGPKRARPPDDDVTGSFRCRQSVPSPCVGGSASGRWSNHAYGLAIDVNPVENPYVGCGRVHDPASARYVDRSRLRKGMVTPAVVRAFKAVGWGWGGDWTGETKDYMHFSWNGR